MMLSNLSSGSRHILRRLSFFKQQGSAAEMIQRLNSSSIPKDDGESYMSDKSSETKEYINFPASGENRPILLNSQEHAVGYLSRILNARVYEAAIETELQEAKNLSSVRKNE